MQEFDAMNSMGTANTSGFLDEMQSLLDAYECAGTSQRADDAEFPCAATDIENARAVATRRKKLRGTISDPYGRPVSRRKPTHRGGIYEIKLIVG